MPWDYRQDQRGNVLADGNGPAVVPKENVSGGVSAPIDGAVIGGVTPAAGSFTTLSTSDLLTAGLGIILPTSDPHRAGAWWDNAGTITKSSG